LGQKFDAFSLHLVESNEEFAHKKKGIFWVHRNADASSQNGVSMTKH